MFEIMPISMTAIDWTKFVAAANRMISRSPTRALDASGVQPGTPPTFISALAEFQRKGGVKTSKLLKHFSFSLLVSASEEILRYISIHTTLEILLSDPGRHKENFILTGTLLDWREAIIESCREDCNIEAREFFNAVWDFLNALGFSDIFSSYRRKDLKDNTWILEHKR